MIVLKVGKSSRCADRLIHFKATCPDCGCVALLDLEDVSRADDLKRHTNIEYICPDCKKAETVKARVSGRLSFLIAVDS